MIIIFDFDGVVVNSIDVSFGINKETVVDLEFSEWQSWFEGNIHEKIRRDLSGEQVQFEFYEKYNERLIELLPVEGIEEVLKKLISMKYKLIINSSSSGRGVNDFLEKYNLKRYFVEVMTREIHRSKVEKFKMILEKYKVKADETLMVTDTVGDVKEAKEVGIKSIGVVWGVHDSKKLEENGADFIANEPKDILKGIEKMIKFTT